MSVPLSHPGMKPSHSKLAQILDSQYALLRWYDADATVPVPL
jgi:hypothetical protein